MNYEVKKYPDGTQYVTVNSFQDHIVFKINSYADLWTLKQVKDVYDHNKRELSITIPSLLDAQADRRFGNNESSGLKLVMDFINSLNFKYVFVFHPHNPEVVEAGLNNCTVETNEHFINEVLNTIYFDLADERSQGKRKLEDDLILMSSDAGGFKPLMKLVDKLDWQGEVFSASKARQYVDGKSKLVQQIDKQDFGGKDILIIDDICVYGGTFVGLAKMLRERNAGKLYLAISHLTVPNPNPDLFKLFNKVFTTNSKFDEYFPTKIEPLGIKMKVSNLDVIQQFDYEL